MEEPQSKRFALAGTIQDYLSIGYLYLLILGIVSDSIYYGILGINILSYSTVLDVLLSPIVRLTSNLAFPIVIIIIPAISYALLKIVQKLNEKKTTQLSMPGFMSSNKNLTLGWIGFSAWLVFSAYMGYGLGGGFKIKGMLKNGDLTIDHRIHFHDQEPQEVKVIGNNSDYIFYILKDSKVVSISPIQENIRRIEKFEP